MAVLAWGKQSQAAMGQMEKIVTYTASEMGSSL
jgi:hypothetical protein